MVDDPDVHRLWQIAIVADTFHQLPSVVARDLDNDPERLSLAVIPLLRYAHAKAVYDSNNKRAIDGYGNSKMMDLVVQNDFDLAKR